VPRVDVEVGAPVRIRIRARDVMIATERPKGLSALNILAGKVASIDKDAGATAEVRIDCGGAAILARITEQSRQGLKLKSGLPVFAVIKTVSFDQANTAAGLRRELDA
jgi:molybdate transport system ATP-binding protein